MVDLEAPLIGERLLDELCAPETQHAVGYCRHAAAQFWDAHHTLDYHDGWTLAGTIYQGDVHCDPQTQPEYAYPWYDPALLELDTTYEPWHVPDVVEAIFGDVGAPPRPPVFEVLGPALTILADIAVTLDADRPDDRGAAGWVHAQRDPQPDIDDRHLWPSGAPKATHVEAPPAAWSVTVTHHPTSGNDPGHYTIPLPPTLEEP